MITLFNKPAAMYRALKIRQMVNHVCDVVNAHRMTLPEWFVINEISYEIIESLDSKFNYDAAVVVAEKNLPAFDAREQRRVDPTSDIHQNAAANYLHLAMGNLAYATQFHGDMLLRGFKVNGCYKLNMRGAVSNLFIARCIIAEHSNCFK